MDPRVLQAITGDAFGGTERFFERLIVALHRDGIQQLVMLRDSADRVTQLREGGLHPVPMKYEGLSFLVRRRIRTYLRNFQPGLVVAWTADTVPHVTGMGVPVLGRWGADSPLDDYRHCQHLLVHRGVERETLLDRGWPPERIHLLPPLVDQAPMEPVSRRTLFTPAQAPLLFAAGQMTKRRDFATLLHVVHRLPDVYLWVAGDGPERENLEHIAYELGIKPRVRFLGWRDNLGALYAASDVVVCGGLDGVPDHAAVEAWAHGKPVVAIGPIDPHSAIRENENALVLPPDDPVTIVQGLKWLLTEPDALDILVNSGRETFGQGYTAPQVLAQYRGLFAHVAQESARA
ncbi:glycosyltransferase [Roseospira marina]|uniref:Glycosyltransferase n=1 Tax=Roseospira marina TaxID=140057 RepID=A0A5M6IHI1_9PROT|nr:glycosyltransferase [Roseospira marina]KAA5607085.1 glycosyltransferase [Roseospira marina]MBB4312722.1 glycosyltransferase involved in cell wall biosynthesis [Roseospira marina]MBB5086505.1 glycosyltransferase involved in cell wall biosynthesis [Roseospira marina]